MKYNITTDKDGLITMQMDLLIYHKVSLLTKQVKASLALYVCFANVKPNIILSLIRLLKSYCECAEFLIFLLLTAM